MFERTTSLKTLVLPAEIKSREFDSRILTGVIAAQKGWRTIIGAKSPLNRRVWKMDGDVYICQTLTKRRQNNLRLFGNLGLAKIGWDEEGLVYYGRDIYLSRRVSQGSLSLMDGLIAWGGVSKKDLEAKARPCGVNVKALGNPRMDLLRPELREFFKKDAAELTAKYGSFILINTNFPSVNPHETVGDARSKVMQADQKASDDAAKRFSDMQDHRKKMLDAFLEFIPELARKTPNINLVVRPHPAESLSQWKKACGDEKNIIISQEGSVIPWLMAAKGLVHNGCTTGIEFYLLGNSPIAYCPYGNRIDDSPLPNGVSHHATTQEELFSLAGKSIKGKLKPTKAHRQIMDRYLSAQKGALSAERVITYCDEILAERRKSETKKIWKSLPTLIYCALRQVHRSTRMGDPARDYIEKVFPLTSLEDVTQKAEQMRELLDLETPVAVRECAVNIFEIRPGD